MHNPQTTLRWTRSEATGAFALGLRLPTENRTSLLFEVELRGRPPNAKLQGERPVSDHASQVAGTRHLAMRTKRLLDLFLDAKRVRIIAVSNALHAKLSAHRTVHEVGAKSLTLGMAAKSQFVQPFLPSANCA